MHQPQHYGDYLKLDAILDAQHPVSFQKGNTPAHDEMLFVVIHQAYELWFKQVLFEVDSVASILQKPKLEDNSADLQTIVHRLQRCVTIMRILVQQVDIMETMTPLDFLDFRDLLRPASGFQSWQFKVLEARLGLKYDDRHGQAYYLSQLRENEIVIIKEAESKRSVLSLINDWLERMPFVSSSSFWSDYENVYAQNLDTSEKQNLEFFQKIFSETEMSNRSLSPTACRSALFIMLYRGYPLLELPFKLMDTLIELDHQLGNWRYRHMNMVRKMIGTRIGTGGSTGAGYLEGAMQKHYIFRELSQLNSFLVDRKKIPALSPDITSQLGYHF